MVPKPGPVVKRPHKRLRPILRPHLLVIERRRIPVRLVKHLGHLHLVCVGTCPAHWIRHVRLAVGTVDVLAVPPRREQHRHHDAPRAGADGEVIPVAAARHGAREAGELQGGVLARFGLGAVGRVADCHAEAGLEGRDLAVGEVVDGLFAVRGRVAEAVADGADALVGAVAGLEEEDGGSVVREVFGWGAAGAGCGCGHVVGGRVHGGVEGVAADDLVEMGRRRHAGVDEAGGVSDGGVASVKKGAHLRVETVDDELSAREAELGCVGSYR